MRGMDHANTERMMTKSHVIQRTSGALLALTFLLSASAPLGCASETRTTTTTTTREPADPDSPVDSRPQVSHTSTTVEKSDDPCGGVLSCTVDFVGDVIAFPFRLVGAVFRAIF
jgi:hypothetical protein